MNLRPGSGTSPSRPEPCSIDPDFLPTRTEVSPCPRPTSTPPGRAALAVAGIGIALFNVAPFLNWVDPRGVAAPRTGYETDSLVPFIAYLGIGLLLAMVYAWRRAALGQHRGLTLVSMAVGIATTVQCVAFALNPMGGLERGDDLVAQAGVYLGILGAAVWAIGSGLLAKEAEGDDRQTTGVNNGDRAAR